MNAPDPHNESPAGHDITACRSCASARLETFLKMGDLPQSDGFARSREAALAAPRFPLDVAFCHDCTLVQILRTVPPETLFGDEYIYLSSVSGVVVENAAANVAARIEEEGLGEGSLVVELASNDGYLLKNYRDAGIPVLGIDPARAPVLKAKAESIETLQAFFGMDVARDLVAERRRADVIHANNVLAHVADTNNFVSAMAHLLNDDGIAVIEFPYLRDLIEHGEFDTIYHEHLCYFSVTAVQALLRRHGLILNRVDRLPIHGGSLRLFARKRGEVGPTTAALLEEERRAGIDTGRFVRDFGKTVEGIREKLTRILMSLRSEGERIACYGAAAKGTILLNYLGMDETVIDFVADKNEEKQGRWVPGVGLPIVAPSRIAEERPSYLMILPWNHKEEIMRQEASFSEEGGRFIVPIPEPRIV